MRSLRMLLAWAPRLRAGLGAILLLACAAAPVPTAVEGQATHEPPGLRQIVGLSFGPQRLGTSWSGPNATTGIAMGQARSMSSARIVPAPGGSAHRQTFGLNAVTGRGVGANLYAKEFLPGNTDGLTVHSYRLWYERGTFRFGGANGEPGFENMGSDGFKLLGYWGGMCPGNIGATQLILWGAPTTARVDNRVTVETNWRLQVRWNNACGPQTTNVQPWVTVRPPSWPTFTAGPWHTYEVLLDAGDPGVANGAVTAWIDGVQAASYRGVIRTAKAPRGWFGRVWDPVLNGKPGLKKTRIDAIDLDNYYVAVGQPVD